MWNLWQHWFILGQNSEFFSSGYLKEKALPWCGCLIQYVGSHYELNHLELFFKYFCTQVTMDPENYIQVLVLNILLLDNIHWYCSIQMESAGSSLFWEHWSFYDTTAFDSLLTNIRQPTTYTQGLDTPGAHYTITGGSIWARYPLVLLWI